MHEVITLQLGQRSNYLATHFWNTQESYFTYSSDQESIVDHDIHFRPGVGADGTETFTPRTVIYDLKGGFGSLKKINALYEIDEPVVPQGLWNGPTVIQRQASIEPNAYQQSLNQGMDPPPLTTDSVRYWSDFNRVFFHPKSIVQLNEYELNSALTPFETWNAGEELFQSLDREYDLLDRDLRPFSEEADQMQGIQIMASIDDAWGGFAARYVDRIKDEYGKKAISFWALEESLSGIPRDKKFVRLSNSAKSVSDISPQTSLYVPMALPIQSLPPYVTLDSGSQWHISGFFSTAMESMTLPSRLRLRNGRHESLDELANLLNINGKQKISRLRMSIDQKRSTKGHLNSERLRKDGRAHSRDGRLPSREIFGDFVEIDLETTFEIYDIDFFPTPTGEQSRGRRSHNKLHVFGQSENYRGDEDPTTPSKKDEDYVLERARRRAGGLPIIRSFPCIFNHNNKSLTVSTSLTTDSAIALRIKTLQAVVDRTIGMDEREALMNSLGQITEAYEEGWDSGSDEDDD